MSGKGKTLSYLKKKEKDARRISASWSTVPQKNVLDFCGIRLIVEVYTT